MVSICLSMPTCLILRNLGAYPHPPLGKEAISKEILRSKIMKKKESILPINNVDLKRHGCRSATAAASQVAGPAVFGHYQLPVEAYYCTAVCTVLNLVWILCFYFLHTCLLTDHFWLYDRLKQKEQKDTSWKSLKLRQCRLAHIAAAAYVTA